MPLYPLCCQSYVNVKYAGTILKLQVVNSFSQLRYASGTHQVQLRSCSVPFTEGC